MDAGSATLRSRMLLTKGDHQVWEGFNLSLETDLSFSPGIHYLEGANGSGKSSFLSRLLLPRLLHDRAVYCLYLEQQMHLQLTAVKAYASLIQLRRRIFGEAETVGYLLDDLLRVWQIQPRPCYVLMDESHCAKEVRDFLSHKLPGSVLIYAAHTEQFPADQTITFQPLSPTRSLVNVAGP